MKGHFFWEKDRRKQVICVIIGICISAVLTGLLIRDRMDSVMAKTSELQKGLAQEVFRFHVLANSDSEEDQQVKLAVRDAVLAYMRESMEAEGQMDGMAEENGQADGEEKIMSAESTKRWAETHLTDIEQIAGAVLEEEGFTYGASAEVTVCRFPDKKYGDVTFPAGDYEALRIRLGKAGGHNWWCVLYPNLCFMDTTCAVVDKDGKEELREALDDEEYEMITAATDFKIRWFFFGEN